MFYFGSIMENRGGVRRKRKGAAFLEWLLYGFIVEYSKNVSFLFFLFYKCVQIFNRRRLQNNDKMWVKLTNVSHPKLNKIDISVNFRCVIVNNRIDTFRFWSFDIDKGFHVFYTSSALMLMLTIAFILYIEQCEEYLLWLTSWI